MAHVFDERNPAVKEMIATAIRVGQGAPAARSASAARRPATIPEFAEFLVEQGIDSISLNPDAVLKTTVKILEIAGRRDVGEATAPALCTEGLATPDEFDDLTAIGEVLIKQRQAGPQRRLGVSVSVLLKEDLSQRTVSSYEPRVGFHCLLQVLDCRRRLPCN